MARHLVIVGEALSRVTDLVQALPHAVPAMSRHIGGRARGRVPVHRAEGVVREQVLEIGEDELLMLLFVNQPHLDHVPQRG